MSGEWKLIENTRGTSNPYPYILIQYDAEGSLGRVTERYATAAELMAWARFLSSLGERVDVAIELAWSEKE